MRLPAVTEAQRTARDYIRDRRGAAAELLEHARLGLADLKYQARVQQDRLLSAGDIHQLESVLAQAEQIEALCTEAMPALQTFEDRFSMPGSFERLKGQFVTEEERPESIRFGDNYEAMTWLADRVLLFSKHLTETLLPWVRGALDEINQSMIDRTHSEDEAPKQVDAAERRLAEIAQAHPGARFSHSEGLLAEARRFLERAARDLAQNYHRGVAENTRQAIEYAAGAVTMAEEGVAFMEDPEAGYLSARDAILAARAEREEAGRPVPSALRRAEELLEQARAAAAGEKPDWSKAILLYNQASAAYADATAEG